LLNLNYLSTSQMLRPNYTVAEVLARERGLSRSRN